MNKEQFTTALKRELDIESYHHDFFNYLVRTERMSSEPLPWSFTSEVLERLSDAKALLDVGNDGGELLTFLRPLPETICALLAPEQVMYLKSKFESLGIGYKERVGESIPYRDESFDFVLNRRNRWSVKEVHRVMQKDGVYITQQTGSIVDTEINKFFESPLQLSKEQWNLEIARKELETTGFEVIEQNEAFSLTRFYDIGAVAYYFEHTPWQVEDFSIDKYNEQLFHIYKDIKSRGFIEMKLHRFFLVAKK